MESSAQPLLGNYAKLVHSGSLAARRHAPQADTESLSYAHPTNKLRIAEHTGRLRRHLFG